MIEELEYNAQHQPRKACFHFEGRSFVYAQVRLQAAALARALQLQGVRRGSFVAADMGNSPVLVLLVAAAAYGGFRLILLNQRLTEAEKIERLADLENCGIRVVVRLDEAQVVSLLGRVGAKDNRAALRDYAERFAAQFSPDDQAVVLFTSGTSGKAKAVSLNWKQLRDAACASNKHLGVKEHEVWQLALPMYHIGGLQIVVRALCAHGSFVLYRRFDAGQIIGDAIDYDVAHISVVDKMLQDLIAEDERQLSEFHKKTSGLMGRHARDCGSFEDEPVLSFYRSILLGGAAANPATLQAARASKARVWASYGMTETASHCASSLVDDAFDGRLQLLPGYEAEVLEPDEQGFGLLALKGPGVCEGYINAQADMSDAGFFITGDRARLVGCSLEVAERTEDLFVSGGENIYPAEIEKKLRLISGVSDAYVFSIPDTTWGRRPVACVERACGVSGDEPDDFRLSSAASAQSFAEGVAAALETVLAKIYRPDEILVLDRFPRHGIGKTDRAALRRIFEQRLRVTKVELMRVNQPLIKPIRTAKTALANRESLIVRIEDAQGNSGLSEGVAFSTPWYLPETLDQDEALLREQLIPRVLSGVYAHPSQVIDALMECAGAAEAPLACAALEPAFWDLYGKIIGKPLWQLLNEPQVAGMERTDDVQHADSAAIDTPSVDAGGVLGMLSNEDLAAAAHKAVDQGITRLKLKIAPDCDLEPLRVLRHAAPNIIITLDANQSYESIEEAACAINALSAYKPALVEEPLKPGRDSRDKRVHFARLAQLQEQISLPICLDESIERPEDLALALEFPQLSCYAVKIAKFGGIAPALEFCRWAGTHDKQIWMGGMYDTSISKRLLAAFQTLPNITLPGDVNAGSYYPTEISTPPLSISQGKIQLNTPEYPHGLGCVLNDEAIAGVLQEKFSFER